MALNSKRMQTFFNEFIITTATFLNQFANSCEEKFFVLERKLTKLESNLKIIESKLASVPSIEETSFTHQNLPSISIESFQTFSEPEPQTVESSPVPSIEDPNINSPTLDEPPNRNLIKISESMAYKKFFKMLKFGIPPAAVKQKMSSEGFDADFLDHPDLLIEKCPEDDEQQ